MAFRALLVLTLVAVLKEAAAAPPERNKCGFEGYNVKPLTKTENEKPYVAASPKGHYKYFFNFCGFADGCYANPTCQAEFKDGKEEIRTVTTTGELYSMLWEKLDEKDFTSIAKKGLGTFDDGLKVNYKIGPKQRSTTIMVPCVEKGNTMEGKSAGYVVEDPGMHYTIVFPSRHGCALPVGQLPIGSIGLPGAGSSTGSKLGMFLMVALCLYCCVGAWYKRERLGAQGTEMIPHIDEIMALTEMCKGCCPEGGAGGVFNKARGVGDDGL